MTKPKPSVSPKQSVNVKSLGLQWLRRQAKRKAWSPLEIWRDSSDYEDWYWTLRARNGNIVADGGESYSSASKARQGFRSAARLAAKALAQMEGGK